MINPALAGALPEEPGSKEREYHLAWFLPHIHGTLVSGRVHYLLVPVDLPDFQARRKFAVITDAGRPFGETLAFMSQMVCLRETALPDGQVSVTERSLIEAVRDRARRAGFAASLPPLRPTEVRPDWARGSLAHGSYLQLVRLGGA